MTITFMALFSAMLSEFINLRLCKSLLIPVLIIGLSSVIYWVVVEDLSFYATVQFLPMLIMPVILIFFRFHYIITSGYWLLLIANVFEKYEHDA